MNDNQSCDEMFDQWMLEETIPDNGFTASVYQCILEEQQKDWKPWGFVLLSLSIAIFYFQQNLVEWVVKGHIMGRMILNTTISSIEINISQSTLVLLAAGVLYFTIESITKLWNESI